MGNKIIEKINEYKTYKDDLNWRDDGNDSPDGQNVEDPSIRDFNKGYEFDPYSMRYFAKLKDKDLLKLAWREVDPLSFTPEYLADKIVKLWNQIDGSLQNTFEAFTLRYDNKLKQEIAKIIYNKYNYEVYPILLIDAPIYASKKTKYKNNLLRLSKVLIPTFGSKLFFDDVKYTMNKTASNRTINILLDYYNRIFPEDYSLKLINNLNGIIKNTDFSEFNDIQISDIALDEMEKLDSGTKDSINLKDGGVGGYDFCSDMREDTTAPGMYEITSKKKVISKEKEIENIPLDLVLDALSDASNNVSELLNINLKRSPVPVSTYVRNDISNIPDKETYESKVGLVNDINEVWEVWEVFLDNKTNIYVIIYADCITNDYTFFKWENITYKGFYSTKQEAINEIKGYL